MKVKALVSFSGKIAMYAGEEREVTDKSLLNDYIKAGFIKCIDKSEEQATEEPAEEQTLGEQQEAIEKRAPAKKAVKNNESK